MKVIYEFEQFYLDSQERQLLRNGKKLRLTQKEFKLLLALLEGNGRLLTKRELIDRVWSEAHVDDHNLKVTISRVRDALGQRKDERSYIETVPKEGYRFAVPVRIKVEEIAPVAPAAASVNVPTPIETSLIAKSSNDISIHSTAEMTGKPQDNLLRSVGAAAHLESGSGRPAIRQPLVNQWWLLAIGGLVVLAGIGVLAARWRAPSPIRASAARQLTDDGRYKRNLRTDGTTLYFNELEVNSEILMSAPAKGGAPQKIETPFPNVSLEDISNDGSKLLVMPYEGIEYERQIWILPTRGGAPRRVGDVLCREARWSPDGARIACTSGTTIVVLNTNGSGAHSLGSFSSVPSMLAWSPDGNHLRFVVQDQKGETGSPWEMDIDHSGAAGVARPAQLPPGENCCVNWAWTTDDKDFVFTRRQADGRLALFIKSLNLRLAPETELAEMGRVTEIASGKSNDAVYFLTENTYRGVLLRADLKQKTFPTLFPGLSAEFLSFSRDGQWMTYVDTVDHSLWRSRVDRTQVLQLTQPPMDVEFSAWSPDGTRIAFMGKRPGKPWRIFLIDREGGIPQEAATGDDNQGAPTWSADGRSLAYANVVCQQTQSCWVRRLDLAAKTVEKVPGSHGLRTARWSPDGKYIAAMQPETHALMLFDVKRQRWTLLAGSITGDNPNWSSDSQYVYADSPHGSMPVIERLRIKGGQRTIAVDLTPLKRTAAQLGFWIGLLPDNSPILVQGFVSSEVYSVEWNDH